MNGAGATNGLSDRIDPGFVTPFIILSITIRQFHYFSEPISEDIIIDAKKPCFKTNFDENIKKVNI